jgi:hypothetical protein
MKTKVLSGILITLYLVASYWVLLYILTFKQAIYLTIEDGFTETLSVICVLLAGGLFVYLFFRSINAGVKYPLRLRRNYFYLLLGLFCIVIVGEEINWGQRILGLNAPEWMGERNSNELNLHNLDTLFYFLGIRVTAGKLFFAFVLLYFVIIPVIVALSAKIRILLEKIQLPVVTVFIAMFYLLNFVLFRLILGFKMPDGYNDVSFPQTVMEIYEINYAFLLLWTSVYFTRNYKRGAMPLPS